VTRHDSHQLKLARLEWELEQRKQLAVMCQKLQAAKETVAKEIQSKRERLDNLTPRLKSILEVCFLIPFIYFQRRDRMSLRYRGR
jgi:THO complex subunit 5